MIAIFRVVLIIAISIALVLYIGADPAISKLIQTFTFLQMKTTAKQSAQFHVNLDIFLRHKRCSIPWSLVPGPHSCSSHRRHSCKRPRCFHRHSSHRRQSLAFRSHCLAAAYQGLRFRAGEDEEEVEKDRQIQSQNYSQSLKVMLTLSGIF
jgi:hypothetical protein